MPRRRPLWVSISGKGGVGKTTLVALLLKVLIDSENDDIILVVDADPATNLPQILGVSINKTIGDVAEEFRKGFERLAEHDIRKYDLLEYLIMRDCLVETEKFDLIAMGRGEGEGCYCYVNSLLSGILSKLVENYTVVLMDMEAGLEHLNRRLDRHANTLIIVVDNSMMSLRTAEKIKEVVDEVNLKIKDIFIVGNKLSEKREEFVINWAKQKGFVYAGTIPEDDYITQFSANGIPLLQLPQDSKAVKAAHKIAVNIGLI